MEQPMMRNEHVVRAHQAPVQAINEKTGTPFEVFHVNNSTSNLPAGTGTWENPFTTLQQAQTAANQPYNIVFVAVGQSGSSPYETPVDGYQFQADNQYLVGEGTSLRVNTANCGEVALWANSTSTVYPVITNPVGPAVVLTNATTTGATVDHLQITGAQVGITDGEGLPEGGIATVNDVRITGNGPSQLGVYIADAAGNSGTVNFTNMKLQNLTADGFVVDGQNTGNPFVNISNSTIKNTSGSAVVVNGIASDGRVRIAGSTIDGSTGPGVTVSGGNAIVEKTTIRNVGNYGVAVTGAPNIGGSSLTTGGTSTVQVAYSTIDSTIGVQGSAPNAGDVVNLTVNGNTLVSPGGGNGVNLAVNEGLINANVVSNKIFGLATSLTTGTTTTSGTTASGVSNILLTTSGTSLTNLTLKAANQNNLRAINNNATVGQQPVLTGILPPPPNYDPSVVVPLPTP
jgi:hypothetical protein